MSGAAVTSRRFAHCQVPKTGMGRTPLLLTPRSLDRRNRDTLPKQGAVMSRLRVILFGSGWKVATIATVLALAGGAAFAASWFVGQVRGGAGGNVAAAAGWERATVEVTEGISLLRGLSPGRLGHFVEGTRTWTRACESASSALRGI